MSQTSLPRILPVIHLVMSNNVDDLIKHGLRESNIAFECGADGVFLISHFGQDRDVLTVANVLKERFPDKLIGVNLLQHSLTKAVSLCQERVPALDLLWHDSPGVRSDGVSNEAKAISARQESFSFSIYGSVAFKYQPHDPLPGEAALLASELGFLPTTSGAGTGSAPSVEKIAMMQNALRAEKHTLQPFAVASGMTPENVTEFAPFVTDLIVSTGISVRDGEFSPELLREFIQKARAASVG